MQYASVDDIKSYLGKRGDEDDALLSRLLRQATYRINVYTQRTFETLIDETRTLDAAMYRMPSNPSALRLPEDLCEFRSAVQNGDPVLGTVVPFPHRPPYSQLRMTDMQWDAFGVIEVTGRWGYSIHPPDDIVAATVRWAAYAYRLRDAQVFDTTSVAEMGQLIVPRGMPNDVREVLLPYKRYI